MRGAGAAPHDDGRARTPHGRDRVCPLGRDGLRRATIVGRGDASLRRGIGPRRAVRAAGPGGPASFAYGKMPRHLYASTTRLIATMYAAWRMSTFFDSRMSQTRPNALTMIPSSFWSTSDFVQKNSERFWTHSKYDTVTPPPFARMSGIRRIPRLWKRSSASGVVGPFAPSAMIFAFTRGAFSDVRTPSRAHGARMSTSSSRTSSFETGFVPGNPTTDPDFSLKTWTSFGSNPFSLTMPPLESETATIFEPYSSCISQAKCMPTLPNP